MVPTLNTAAADEHVPDIERYIRTVKERTRSTYTMLPYRHLPRIVLIHLVKNVVFWLNAFPTNDGVSKKYSPRYIMTGQQLSYSKHAIIEFGAYVQTHEQHSNNMDQRTMSAICLGPTGNQQGGHWFMSLSSGRTSCATPMDGTPNAKRGHRPSLRHRSSTRNAQHHHLRK